MSGDKPKYNPDDDFNADKPVTPEEQDAIEKREAERMAKLDAKLLARAEALKAGRVVSPSTKPIKERFREGLGVHHRDRRILVTSQAREDQAKQPPPSGPEGEKIADTVPKAKESEQLEIDKARIQEVIDNFIFTGRFDLEPSTDKPGKYIFELFDTRNESERLALKQRRKTIEDILVVLQKVMKHTYKEKQVE